MPGLVNERTYFGFNRSRGDASRVNDDSKGVPTLLVPTTARDMHFASAADVATDWNVSNPTHPSLYIHSETTPATDYGVLSHDGDNLTIQVFGGGLILTPVTDVVISDGTGLLIGSATQVTVSDGDGVTDLIPEFQVLGTGAPDSSGLIAAFNTTNTRAVAPRLVLVKGAAATQVATTAVADNEVVGVIIAHASDSVDFETPVGSIEFVVDDPGAPGAGAIGGSIEFYTTADGGETLTLAFTINSNQNVYIQNNNGLIVGNGATVAVDGVTAEFQVLGTSGDDSAIAIVRNSADLSSASFFFAKSRNPTIGSFTIVVTGDLLGDLSAYGDDGVDFNANANASAAIRFLATGTIAADRVPGEIRLLTATDAQPSVLTLRWSITNAGTLAGDATASIRANTATEIAISVTNDAITVGSEGSMIAPYLSQTGPAFTDAIGGNINGCFGFNDDNDSGPVRTLEARMEGAWLSVAVAGYLMQNRVPWVKDSTFLHHPDQLVVGEAHDSGNLWLDESRCFLCGEPMLPGEQLTFWANGRYERGTHAIFGHTHLEENEVIKQLTQRIAELEGKLGASHEHAPELVAA